MKIVETVSELRQAIREQKQNGRLVGFVPTMGNLHQGHLALVGLAKENADYIVASIFVNPLQFGEGEDYEKYPRTHDDDINKLTEAGCDLLFLPSVETMYPLPIEQQTRVEVPGLSHILCGVSRPIHFAGVATVVSKLFNLVMPDKAVFGLKDFQQLSVIRQMVKDLCIPVEIIGAPIVRESDGLAMSSRNGYLSTEQRQKAPGLYKVLSETAEKIKSGDTAFEELEKTAQQQLQQLGFEPEYFSVRRSDDLKLPQQHDLSLVILVAVRLGSTRLIDNIEISQ